LTDPTNNPKVSIIILNYNAGDLLLNCVESVFKTSYNNIEVLVVDNASKDQSHKKCKEKFSKIILIENEQNLGYCEGNNVGIREAIGEFIVILNPDTIVDHNWITELVLAYSKYGDGLYQPKIISLYEENILQSTGNMIHLFGFGFARDKGSADSNKRNRIEQVGYASGTCLFTSQKVLKKIGLFDPFLFLYHDDLDLGWRAAQIDIKSYYVPSSAVYHVESYNFRWSSKKFYWLERNRRYCLLTHYSKNTYKKMFPYLLQAEILVWLFYLTKGFVGPKIRAELEIIKNKKHIQQRYYELESKKIVPDTELIKSFPDEIFVPKNVSGGFGSYIFNLLLKKLSQKAKDKIIK
jgi:GT2 family glycosyltransferase